MSDGGVQNKTSTLTGNLEQKNDSKITIQRLFLSAFILPCSLTFRNENSITLKT
jgi:hypothetical protein